MKFYRPVTQEELEEELIDSRRESELEETEEAYLYYLKVQKAYDLQQEQGVTIYTEVTLEDEDFIR